MDESKTELEMRLDRSLKLEMRRAQFGGSGSPHNCMIRARADDDVLSFVRKWAERNDIHLFVLDWTRLDSKYVDDDENGLLKDLSQPRTVMYLENYTGVEHGKRCLVSDVYKNRDVGSCCKPVPNFLFAIATTVVDDPNIHLMDMAERSCFGTVDFLTEEERHQIEK